MHGESFNFGPNADQNRTVQELLIDLYGIWRPEVDVNSGFQVVNEIPFDEAGLLKLNCDKALSRLRWKSVLQYDECINMVGEWYKKFYTNEDMRKETLADIRNYENLAYKRELEWITD